jgi:hypothetical protein
MLLKLAIGFLIETVRADYTGGGEGGGVDSYPHHIMDTVLTTLSPANMDRNSYLPPSPLPLYFLSGPSSVAVLIQNFYA